ncbi:MAG: hypothetical protein R3254_05010 [Thiomicrorhabdus sp.]|nr:hypothetical protein [Thiomicrorhabdus sp.]
MKSNQMVPLDWIRIELLPLPGVGDDYPQFTFWWNPEQGLIEGEIALVEQLVNNALALGSVTTQSNAMVEITNPYHKPTELAAILGQYYWLIPQPVSNAYAEPDDLDNGFMTMPSLQ